MKSGKCQKGPDRSQPHPVLTPLTTAQAERLVRLAQEAVAKRGISMRYDGAGALVTVGDDGLPRPDRVSAGLMNLARRVAELPRQLWRAAVAEHFDQMPASAMPPLIPDDLENELYLRLVCASTIDPGMAEGTPEFMPGVLTVPATYTGRAVAMHFNVENLGISREEATRTGLKNLRRLRDEVEAVHICGAELTMLTGSMMTASRALVFDTVLRESLQIENPSLGCLVALPARDMLLVHVLRDQTALNALAGLVAFTADMFGSRPGPVSPHVYYVIDNEWHQVTDYSTGAFHLLPTEPLETAMRHLGVTENAS